jgi:hypothetical protein
VTEIVLLGHEGSVGSL